MGIILSIILYILPLQAQESVHQLSLNEAIRYYHSGDRPSAMQKLLSLTYNNEAPEALKIQANVYIGEIMYIQGDKESAQRRFEQVLQIDPGYRIDRFRHPPEVCSFFDFVKSYINIPKDPDPPPKRNASIPLVSYLPYGLYQVQYEKSWKGYTYLTAQAITSATSISLLIYLNYNNSYAAGDTEKKASLEQLVLLQRTSTILFYSLWAISAIDAHNHWKIQLKKSNTGDPLTFLPYVEWNTDF